MKLYYELTIPHSPEYVWDLLDDKDFISSCIPGLDHMTESEDGVFDVKMNVGIGVLRGKFSGTIRVVDKRRPDIYRMAIKSSGLGGWIEEDVTIYLKPFSSPGTEGSYVSVRGNANVGGMLTRIGQRFMNNASTSLMEQFFNNVQEQIKRRSPSSD